MSHHLFRAKSPKWDLYLWKLCQIYPKKSIMSILCQVYVNGMPKGLFCDNFFEHEFRPALLNNVKRSAILVGDGFPYQDWTSHFPASWKWRRLRQNGDGYVYDNDHLTHAILLAPKVLLEDRWPMMTTHIQSESNHTKWMNELKKPKMGDLQWTEMN